MKVSSNKRILRPSTASLNEELSGITEKIVSYDGKIDYEKNVVKKPTFNGKEMVGDIQDLLSSTYITKDGDKVLSTNDYTDEEKAKLESVTAGATITKNEFQEFI